MTSSSKERPILFSAPMVRMLLGGSKTQTRRVVKNPERYEGGLHNCLHCCPYGQPGDRLWVRETFFAFGRWETRYSEKKGRDEWHFIDMTLECGLTHGFAEELRFAKMRELAPRGGASPTWWKRPAIFMPRVASRILLEVTRMRVERLQDISKQDAMDEGFYQAVHESPAGIGQNVVGWYRRLWVELNGAGSWDLNPFVWVVEFRRTRP